MMWCKAPARGLLLRGVASLAAVLTLGACDSIPTEAPGFESRFVIPTDSTALAVSELLPNEVQVVGSNFQLNLAPVTIPRTLGQLCTACVPFNGQSVPYPGFSATVPVTIAMPAKVASTILASGSITVGVANSFGFDPLRPPGAATTGKIVITITNGGRTIGRDSITSPLPNGQTTPKTITLVPGTLSGPIDVSLAITSPAGGTAPANFVTINTSNGLSATATPTAILLSSADVLLPPLGDTVNVNQVTLDLEDIDEGFSERVLSGAIVLKMTNPFAVTGSLDLTITDTNGSLIVAKKVDIAAGPTTKRIEFSRAELLSILGRNVVLSIKGPVTATSGGIVTVTPAQVLSIQTTLDLVVQIGGEINQ